MYYNDKRQKVSVRLTDVEWDFILTLCDETGKSPSDMIRYCIDNVAISYAIAREELTGVLLMALTAKPISTISYNTEPFLEKVLIGLISSHKVEMAYYIKHKGEDGDKDHFHVYIVPNKRLDTAVLRDEFQEPCPDNEIPLGCMRFQSSKVSDWLLYAVHDKRYLLMHSNDEALNKIEYSRDDIKVLGVPRQQLVRDFNTAQASNGGNVRKAIEINKLTGSVLDMAMYVNPTQALALMRLLAEDARFERKGQLEWDVMTELNGFTRHIEEMEDNPFEE